MSARFLAPALLVVGMLACSTDLPLEAQRGRHNQPAVATQNPLTFQKTATVDGAQQAWYGTITITQITKTATGSLAVSGTIDGVLQNATRDPFSGTFTGVPLTLSPSSPSCAVVNLHLGPMTVAGKVLQFPTLDLGSYAAPKSFMRNLCRLAKGDTSVLPAINAALGA